MRNLKITQSLINELIKHNPHDKIIATNYKGLQIHKKKTKSIFFYSRKINNVTFKKSLGDIKIIDLLSLNKIINDLTTIPQQEIKKLIFSDICDHYMENVVPLYSPTYRDYCRLVIKKKLKIYFNNFDINDITKKDVIQWMMTFETLYKARNHLVILSSIIKHAQRMGFHDKMNPCKGLSKRSKRVIRYLTKKEFKSLSKAFKTVTKERDLIVVDIIKLLIFTGARRSEIAYLKWKDIREKKIFLMQSKTGEKVIYLSNQALQIVNKYKGNNDSYVFSYNDKKINIGAISKVFKDLKHNAQIENLRMHDLRHTFASIGVQAQISLTTLGQILGHKDPESTLIYTHLDNTTIDQATEQVSDQIFQSLVNPKGRR